MVGLYLVQHGEAVPDDVDPARPLSQAGKKDVERLAEFLARRKLAVSRILHSGKLRAQQTAELIAYTNLRGLRLTRGIPKRAKV